MSAQGSALGNNVSSDLLALKGRHKIIVKPLQGFKLIMSNSTQGVALC